MEGGAQPLAHEAALSTAPAPIRLPTIDASTPNPSRHHSISSIMKTANDSRIYSFVLVTLLREGRTNECVETLERMRERGIDPTPFMYSVVLRALKLNDDWKRSITLLLPLVLRTKQIDKNLLETVLLTCIQSKEYQVLVKLVEELPRLSSPNAFEPTWFILTQYIYGCYKLKEVSTWSRFIRFVRIVLLCDVESLIVFFCQTFKKENRDDAKTNTNT